MATLRIRLFGLFRVALADDSSSLSIPPSTRNLLAFLLLQPNRLHPRDALAAVCWSERPNDQARACLNTALWRLRRALDVSSSSAESYVLTSSSGEVGFNWESDHWVDLEVFESTTGRYLARPPDTLTPAAVKDLEAVLALYDADLLEGFYEDWALQERERLRLIYLDCLARLMHYHTRTGSLEGSLNFGQMILRHDPLREEIHRQLMRLHWRLGERDRAVRQYQQCREILAAELGIPPMPETEVLYAEIMSGTAVVDRRAASLQSTSATRAAPANLQDAVEHLTHAKERLAAARRDIEQAERLVQGLQAGQG